MKGTPEKLAQYLFELDKNKIYEIKEIKKTRNLKSNAKYWKLINELSKKLKIGVYQLHKQMLRDYSKQGQICTPSSYDMSAIKYYDLKSKFVKNDIEYSVYQVYTPSHELKTDEFAILLDGLIQEAIQQGIDVRSPSEIERDAQLYEKSND